MGAVDFRAAKCMAFAALASLCLCGTAQALDLRSYQPGDGAITTTAGGDAVDPYFAMKALWVSRTLGGTPQDQELQWISWLLARQGANGSFPRFCRTDTPSGDSWRACADADADDATLALWIALLTEASAARLPVAWAQSLAKAAHYLARAQNLRTAMAKAFGSKDYGLLAWSAGGDLGSEQFYPHRVAHLYPWIHGVPTGSFGPVLSADEWFTRFADGWLTRSDDAFAWGLVALFAYQQHKYSLVDRWLESAQGVRSSAVWNVLDETLFQELSRARQMNNVRRPAQ